MRVGTVIFGMGIGSDVLFVLDHGRGPFFLSRAHLLFNFTHVIFFMKIQNRYVI